MARTRIRMADASDEHRLDVVGDGSGGEVPSEDDVEGDEDGEGDEEAAEKNAELGSTTYDVGGTGDLYQATHEGIEIHLPSVRVAEWIKYKGTGVGAKRSPRDPWSQPVSVANVIYFEAQKKIGKVCVHFILVCMRVFVFAPPTIQTNTGGWGTCHSLKTRQGRNFFRQRRQQRHLQAANRAQAGIHAGGGICLQRPLLRRGRCPLPYELLGCLSLSLYLSLSLSFSFFFSLSLIGDYYIFLAIQFWSRSLCIT